MLLLAVAACRESANDPAKPAAEPVAAVQAMAALGPSSAVAAPRAKPATDHTGCSAVGRTPCSAIIASNVAR